MTTDDEQKRADLMTQLNEAAKERDRLRAVQPVPNTAEDEELRKLSEKILSTSDHYVVGPTISKRLARALLDRLDAPVREEMELCNEIISAATGPIRGNYTEKELELARALRQRLTASPDQVDDHKKRWLAACAWIDRPKNRTPAK